MAAIGLTNPALQFFDNNGDPLAGGLVNVYVTGTTTRTDTWFNSDLAIGHKNTNPIQLDSAGRCVMYLDTTPAIKLVVTDANSVLVYSQDAVSPAALAT